MKNNRGYYLYSTFAIISFLIFFGWIGYLIYDIAVKVTFEEMKNEILVQALVTLIVTVFLGGFLNKGLEHRNYKKNMLFKIKTEICLKIIDLSSILYFSPRDSEILELLHSEQAKVKLYFSDETLVKLQNFINNDGDRDFCYNLLIESLKSEIK